MRNIGKRKYSSIRMRLHFNTVRKIYFSLDDTSLRIRLLFYRVTNMDFFQDGTSLRNGTSLVYI